jgi:hypothetical protein
LRARWLTAGEWERQEWENAAQMPNHRAGRSIL